MELLLLLFFGIAIAFVVLGKYKKEKEEEERFEVWLPDGHLNEQETFEFFKEVKASKRYKDFVKRTGKDPIVLDANSLNGTIRGSFYSFLPKNN